MELKKIEGPQKAAILLLSLGVEGASEMMRGLEEHEVQKLSSYMAQLGQVPTMVVEKVLEEFRSQVEDRSGLLFGREEYARQILGRAFGEKKAEKLLTDLLHYSDRPLFFQLRRLEAKTLVNIFRYEHPQTIAVVLAHLDADQAVEVLRALPEMTRNDVLFRMACLERVDPEILNEIDEIISQEVANAGSSRQSRVGGFKSVAEILNLMNQTEETSVLAKIEENHPEMAEKIRKEMFVFDDLIRANDRGIQELLKEVKKDDLLMAMKTASPATREKIFQNLSERAAEMMKEDLVALGPMRVRDVEKAQQAVLKVAKRLEGDGKIFFEGRGGDEEKLV